MTLAGVSTRTGPSGHDRHTPVCQRCNCHRGQRPV